MCSISGLLINLLRAPPVYCAVVNRFAEPEASHYLRKLGYRELTGLPLTCFSSEKIDSTTTTFPPSPQNNEKLLYYYVMDLASLYPVLALSLHPSDEVFEMCAAPGGKAFAMLQMVRSEEGGALALNDAVASRVQRLHHVVRKCVRKGVLHSVRITKRKGEAWGEQSIYNKVLVDAPCSSDRHNIDKWVAKNQCWPESAKYKRLQGSLLLSALHAVKAEGVVVYSTCTMSAEENDAVVQDAMGSAQKCGYGIDVVDPLSRAQFEGKVEHTEHGKLITPSTTLNVGPMFLSKLCVTKK